MERSVDYRRDPHSGQRPSISWTWIKAFSPSSCVSPNCNAQCFLNLSITHICRRAILGKAQHRRRCKPYEPSSSVISLPHLRLLVLSNNHVLRHLKVPWAAHLELNCETNLSFPSRNLENLPRLEGRFYTKTTGAKGKILTDIGPSGFGICRGWISSLPSYESSTWPTVGRLTCLKSCLVERAASRRPSSMVSISSFSI